MPPPKFFAHLTALAESTHIGAGTRIWAYAHVLRGAKIGRDCNVGDHAFVEGGAVIGHRVTLKNGVMVWDGVTIEDEVFVGPGVLFTNDPRPRSPRLPLAAARYGTKDWLVATRIKRGASLGAGAIIVCGVTVGRFAMVGAGAVVTRDVPDHALVTGVSAKVCGWVSETGRKLEFGLDQTAICPDTNTRWRLVSGRRLVRLPAPR
ncbi:MAG: N-acetyltransferase [Gammaproteobacteria bacterium]|nr:N-acetyltransferase [Gammaproteobacteria bacterium]